MADPALADETQLDDSQLADETQDNDGTIADPDDETLNSPANDDLTQMNPLFDDNSPLNGDNTAADDSFADETQAQQDETQQQDNPQQQDDPQQDEGSGGGGGFFGGFPSFSFPSFFRTFSSRQSRQLYSPCTDRITLPCIVEDFIGAGMGDIPTCIPVHCGSTLCQAGIASCKVETSVTPFHIGVHFGDGKINKGSPEDNIGACLRYKQLPCS